MATGSTSGILLPEAFTALNDLESCMSHFELLAKSQKWREEQKEIQRSKLKNGHITLHLGYKNLPLYRTFYRILPQCTKQNYDECNKFF